MEYHKDRFDDISIVVRKDAKMVAGLPAHRIGDLAKSHGGLTYGGFFHTPELKLGEVFFAFEAALRLLKQSGISNLEIKPVPAIYHQIPSDELLQALFIAKAQLMGREVLSVADLRAPSRIAKTRREAIARGKKNALEIREVSHFDEFWNQILIPNLQRRYGALPVHSQKEIEQLHQLFPNNIRQFNVYDHGQIVAGTTVFESDRVAHPQYLSALEDRNQTGAIDYLYHHLMDQVFDHKSYFDFGTSVQDGKISSNLVFWKESFGARSIVQDQYLVNTANHKLLLDAFV